VNRTPRTKHFNQKAANKVIQVSCVVLPDHSSKTCTQFSIIYDHALVENSTDILRGTNEIHIQVRRTRAVNFILSSNHVTIALHCLLSLLHYSIKSNE
jgi:hypothetical protein